MYIVKIDVTKGQPTYKEFKTLKESAQYIIEVEGGASEEIAGYKIYQDVTKENGTYEGDLVTAYRK